MADDVDAQVIAHLRELQQRTAARPDPPPLRIHHPLVCAVVVAIELSLLRFVMSLSSQPQTLVGSGAFGFTQVLNAVGLTLIGFSIFWWRQGYASLSQPGHMLLFQYAGSFILFCLNIAIMLAIRSTTGTLQLPSGASWLPVSLNLSSLLFGVVVPAIFFGWCAWRIADSWAWRVLFVLCALGTMMTMNGLLLMRFLINARPYSMQTIVGVAFLTRGTMLLTAGIAAVATDLTARRKRSWTHWAGVILWLLSQIGVLFTGLYNLFIWQIR